ncbi:hypothetical protein [Cryptosporangium sp. NPDC048952]|uniref:hypothetical protein n=1 Tax=Cryptosporangium sp. NPDC048952 TaxID=3363961 RepID=UPI00371B2712
MSDDTDLAAALAAEYEHHRSHTSAPGGPTARATVTRRRRRNAAAAVVGLVLIVAAGIGLARGAGTPDRLVPATPAAPSPSSTTDTLSEIQDPDCGDPAAKYRDKVEIDSIPADTGWTLTGPTAQFSGDNYLAFLTCSRGSYVPARTWLVMLTGWNAKLRFTGHPYPLSATGRPSRLPGLSVNDHGTISLRSRLGDQETDVLLRWEVDQFRRAG